VWCNLFGRHFWDISPPEVGLIVRHKWDIIGRH
jgi:hypothetical protein